MRLLLVTITFIWFCCGVGYAFYDFKMPSLAIAVTGFIAFLTAFINYRQNSKKDKPMQSQKLKGKSFGMQAGQDLNITFNKADKDE
ncbi:hypothetical protein [Acinetobacter pittii]|jgi:hypothetical protein|uniref:hypothetical protein n=1 Tax=Acinetobacter pittii TaxID=48296 RepID=UPI0005EB525A|nr:hypothetical protein [Acinetobacter pittii]MCE6629864.1 hypothetical protein [Acinetobacter pittii]MDP7812729.1 hypothetical protein [Acinetobacter pittii]OCY22079.1 hypothetical protein BFR62_10060 [Acinetobacter pittii]RZG94534.1 hypothetical protein EXE07_13850 [Acinetobacter pittii]